MSESLSTPHFETITTEPVDEEELRLTRAQEDLVRASKESELEQGRRARKRTKGLLGNITKVLTACLLVVTIVIVLVSSILSGDVTKVAATARTLQLAAQALAALEHSTHGSNDTNATWPTTAANG